ncbi:MAG: 23S rRNA (cytidine(2498)-2'-O)-methyltransferase RlmM [Thiotrichales bacterium]|nr:MAG: 23S rRNA (cytidine(2498)-2'-O)-methyltransferase RlmM [Thiotrichales bacterium]
MDTLHQIMLLCRPGFETECAAEIMDITSTTGFAAYINAKPDTGFVLLISAEGKDTTGLISEIEFDQLIFTRQWFASTEKIDHLPEKNRATPLADRARQIAEQLDIRFSDIELSYADTNEGKALNRFCKSFRPHLQNALRQQQLLSGESRYRLHLFFRDSSTAWLGASPLDNSARAPMGIPRLRMPQSAPSRSTLKLDEAINWFFSDDEQKSWFRAGMHAVDLGAAPGGWSWQLVERGLLVTAVDNGPMDSALMQTGMIEHLRTDAFTFKPARNIDWLVCDMAERPLHVSRLIARWFTLGYCKAAIFNLKLPMKKRYQSILECRQLLNRELDNAGIKHRLRVKHLYHDREEVTACLTRSIDHR